MVNGTIGIQRLRIVIGALPPARLPSPCPNPYHPNIRDARMQEHLGEIARKRAYADARQQAAGQEPFAVGTPLRWQVAFSHARGDSPDLRALIHGFQHYEAGIMDTPALSGDHELRAISYSLVEGEDGAESTLVTIHAAFRATSPDALQTDLGR